MWGSRPSAESSNDHWAEKQKADGHTVGILEMLLME